VFFSLKLSARLFRSGDYSDLEVTCAEGTSFKVHKAIVCSQSKYFANACRPGGFKVCESLFSCWLALYQSAYLGLYVQESVEDCVKLESSEPEVVHALLQYLYSLEYEAPIAEPEVAAMTFHAKMYAASDYFGVDSLKCTAKERFEKTATENWDSDEFVTAVQLVYGSTPSHDRSLRDTVAQLCSTHFQELMSKREHFGELMSANGDLGKDMCEILARRYNFWAGYRKFQCQGCNHIWADARPLIGNTHCPGCENMMYRWDEFEVT
jgi:hypothetical protein